MTHIEVLGPGCAKCKVLFEHADKAAKELGLEYDIKKVTDITAIMGYGVMSTPALVVNGELKFSGRVPSAEQLKGILS
jgi:small redox-active disulfide protein 2